MRRGTKSTKAGAGAGPTRRRKPAAPSVRPRRDAEARLAAALEHQAATAEILRVISRSPGDVQPVFDAIVQSAARLCEAEFSAVARVEDGLLHLAAISNMSPAETRAYHSLFPRPPRRDFIIGRAFVDGAPVHETASLADDDLLLFRTRWDVLDRGLEPATPGARDAVGSLAEVDRLDVGNPQDEALHGYSVASRAGDLPVGATVAIAPVAAGEPPLADAGRLVLGHESFRVRSTRRGRELVVLMRTRSPVDVRFLRASGPTTAAVAVAEGALVLRAGGRVVATVRLAGTEGWNEHVLRVPGTDVSDGATALTLSGRYASYRFWFYQ